VGLGHLKPEIVAPGIDIFTTYLSNTFGYFTGTSAAAPHVSGAAALLKQQHPEWGPEELRNALVNNADDIGESVIAQGAGRLNVSASAKAGLRASPDLVAFEETVGGKVDVTDRETITLNNTHPFQVDGTIAVNCYYSADQELQELISPELVVDYIQPPSSSFSVPANGTLDIEFQQNIPMSAKEGYYWGTIEFSSANDNLTVPFGFQYLDIGSDLGEWVVSSDTIKQNERIKFTNLTVTNNAKLELYGVTLFVSSHKDGLSEIRVTPGAELVMDGSIVTNFNPSIYYNFSLYGKGTITNSRFSGMYGTYDSPYPGGINIYSEGTEVSNTTIFRCFTNGIFSDGASNILLADNHIYQNGGEGILLWDSDNVRVLRNNVSMNWWDGIGFTSTSGIIADNEVHFNSYDGLWINHSSPLIINNNLTNSFYRENHEDSAGLKLQRQSEPVLENNTFSDNIYYGVYINGSSPLIWNTSVQGSKTDDIYISSYQQNFSKPYFINSTYISVDWPLTDSDSVLTRQWFVDVSVGDDIGNPIEGAEVRLVDVNDAIEADVRTGSTGKVPKIIATQYVRTLAMTDYRTPYKLEVNKSSIKNNSLTDIQITSSTSFDIILPLPDIGVTAVYHEPAISYLNETINFTITLFNNASFDMANVTVECILDGKAETFAEFTVASIKSKSEYNLSFQRKVLTAGVHSLEVAAALDEALPERSYTNNILDYSFTVLSRPEAADISILQKFTYIHEPINFQAKANITSGNITGYQFRFSDGTVLNWQANDTIQYFFSNTTFVSISFRVRSDNGAVSNWSKEVWFEIIERAVGDGITFEPAGGDITTQFSFTPSSGLEDVSDIISSYQWTFGDGTVSDQKTPTHKYLQDKTYNVTLTIKYTTDGALKMFYSELTVSNTEPKATFFVSQATVLPGEAVTFNAGATTDIDDDSATELTYFWEFGDGSTGTGIEVEHTYDTADTFVVILTVTDDDNAESQFMMNITVRETISPGDDTDLSGLDRVTLAIILVGVMIAVLVALALVLTWMMRRKKSDEEDKELEEIEE
jgi:parallel beta-helix repeat protein